MNAEGAGASKYQPAPTANKLPRLANPPTTLWIILHIFLSAVNILIMLTVLRNNVVIPSRAW